MLKCLQTELKAGCDEDVCRSVKSFKLSESFTLILRLWDFMNLQRWEEEWEGLQGNNRKKLWDQSDQTQEHKNLVNFTHKPSNRFINGCCSLILRIDMKTPHEGDLETEDFRIREKKTFSVLEELVSHMCHQNSLKSLFSCD